MQYKAMNFRYCNEGTANMNEMCCVQLWNALDSN